MTRISLLFFLLIVLFAVSKTQLSAQTFPDYIGSETCKSCHETEFSHWQGSHHAKAWMLPDDKSVDGDFENAEFSHDGKTTRFFRKGGAFFIETNDITGGTKTLELKGVAGIAPLQQYLFETEPGRLQAFDVVWDQKSKTWYHLYPEQSLPPEDGYHWTGPYKNWNARCAECHATGFQKNYDSQTRTYSSAQAEIGVGCEACHGPAEAHVIQHESPLSRKGQKFTGIDSQGFLLSFSDGKAQTEIQQCAGCHSRREPFQDGNPLPGTPFHDTYRLALLRSGLYHADGQILDEVYVVGSFLQSKMHEKGIRCSDCHEPHTANLKADGNAVCTQCHSDAGNARFPSLALKKYDDPSHHFHEQGTNGANCVSCHMIERIYMGIDGRRDHSFRVPRPDVSARAGAPNACNDCHQDKSYTWAADVLEKQFPESGYRAPHFAEVFANARDDATGFGSELLQVALQNSFPGIVRASAIDLLRSRATPLEVERAAILLQDPDPLVRSAAIALQARRTAKNRIDALEESLVDPVRSVRVAAARALLGLEVDDRMLRQKVQEGMTEWQEALAAKLDFPETHMIIGGTALALRNPRAAVKAFQEATVLDPQLAEAWVMQVRLHLALGDFASAEFTLQKALNLVPANSDLLELKRQMNK